MTMWSVYTPHLDSIQIAENVGMFEGLETKVSRAGQFDLHNQKRQPVRVVAMSTNEVPPTFYNTQD